MEQMVFRRKNVPLIVVRLSVPSGFSKEGGLHIEIGRTGGLLTLALRTTY
jgi:hypothetical protein